MWRKQLERLGAVLLHCHAPVVAKRLESFARTTISLSVKL